MGLLLSLIHEIIIWNLGAIYSIRLPVVNFFRLKRRKVGRFILVPIFSVSNTNNRLQFLVS